MKQVLLTVTDNQALTATVYKMTLCGDVSDITAAGQFVNIKIDGLYLRRPISVCDCENGTLTLVYKVVGVGTKALADTKVGALLDVLVGLGNGYDLTCSGDQPLLIGGGVGVPPLFMAAKHLLQMSKDVTVILGFNTANEIFLKEDFEAIGAKVIVATADGSVGVKGFVTDAMQDVDYTYFYTCGPEPMLKAVFTAAKTSGEFSFEERMGCGFGACMGCSCKTVTGYKRICKDGPVLKKEEILW